MKWLFVTGGLGGEGDEEWLRKWRVLGLESVLFLVGNILVELFLVHLLEDG